MKLDQYFTLHQGDCLPILKTLPDNSIDSIVTDGPYGLSKEPDMLEVQRSGANACEYSNLAAICWLSSVPGRMTWEYSPSGLPASRSETR